MKKTFFRAVALLALVCLVTASFAGCDTGKGESTNNVDSTSGGNIEVVDYVANLTLDMTSTTKKVEVKVKNYVDGDTTHFYADLDDTGVVKARYIAVNTPESTGKIEEWGKAASRFTKEKLQSATSIILESDDENWNIDSTGSRYLVWVWYKTADSEEYRNLNLELLQNGLAIASSSNNNRYGTVCMAAIEQARAQKLYIYSGEQDPDFYYGTAVELDLKELRTNVEKYSGQTVAFNGVVTKNSNNTAYVEAYDSETDMYYGMTVYYGFSLSGKGLEILNVGNEVRIVGSVQYYETAGTWQVSDISYRQMKPNDPSNIQLIESGKSASYRLTNPADLLNREFDITDEEGNVTSYKYGQLALSTSVSMEKLTVTNVYTTNDEDSSSKGAMTLTCKAEDGTVIQIRTVVLHDSEGNLVTESYFSGKVITVKGILDYFSGSYQIKVFNVNDIDILN